jgi:hypothetical protein
MSVEAINAEVLFIGDICEICVYAKSLSPGDVANLATYAARWGSTLNN